jgi:hypothetical protein
MTHLTGPTLFADFLSHRIRPLAIASTGGRYRQVCIYGQILTGPQTLAAQLALVMDGAWIAARLFPRGDNPATQVEAAKALIEAHRHVPSRNSAKRRR